jgi:hypothetical protein
MRLICRTPSWAELRQKRLNGPWSPFQSFENSRFFIGHPDCRDDQGEGADEGVDSFSRVTMTNSRRFDVCDLVALEVRSS